MLFNIISISLGAILINNFIFSQFLGCCPFLGCSNKTDTAFGMGVAVIFVMGMASAICWLIDTYILVPLGLAFLETLAFILIIAALVQLVEMFLKKSVPALYSALGIYLPLTASPAASASCSRSCCLPPCVSASSLPSIPNALRDSRSALSPLLLWRLRSWASAACRSSERRRSVYEYHSSFCCCSRRDGCHPRGSACHCFQGVPC